MRCEFCRDPGRVPKAVEICRNCAPLFDAMEDVAEAAMEMYEHNYLSRTPRFMAACAALKKLEAK